MQASERRQSVTVRLSEAEISALDQLAKQYEHNRSQALRAVLRAWMAKKEPKV